MRIAPESSEQYSVMEHFVREICTGISKFHMDLVTLNLDVLS